MSEVKCSTCKGEKTLTFEQGQRCVPCVTCSGSGTDWRKTYDAALSQLAALREELVSLRRLQEDKNSEWEDTFGPGYEDDTEPLDTLVEVVDLESQLAALREELAEAQRVLSFSGNEADAHNTAALHTELEDTQQRLADAERRNAVLVNLLRETCGHYSVLTGIILTLSREDHLTSEPMRKSAYAACDHGKKINAALNKPEEAKS